MSLTLHYHPLASFCWKVLIGLYENATPFEPVIVDLGDPEGRTAFLKVSPFGKMPALVDSGRGETVFETTIILDYLDRHYPWTTRFTPEDPDAARQVRLWDRIFDTYVQEPMQKIVGDRIRPPGTGDAFGVEQARGQLAQAYAYLEPRVGDGWMAGEFGLADCAAAPALYYADKVAPFGTGHPRLTAYLERLKARPSFARVLEEAQPYFHMFPQG
jgi:glutathione S-transferase